ncbi:MAG: hypothetical protein JRI23_05720 [Deltaproteobacteria bacterium]|jgi:hypothetical protein|nr:hypothetical protein [Deltaproteobacteria bacterium]MBW2531060.1 hypothetical protein [Deltaproteobacteria bacterium]
MSMTARLTAAEMKAFEPEAKIGILATLDGDEKPHISLITSLRAKTPTQLMWGQFIEGRSKQQVRTDPRTGFAVMNAERSLWRGKARWTHEVHEGEDYELFNRLPMFRYNSYLGIHTVHYMDLFALQTRGRVSLPRVAAGLTIAALVGARARRSKSAQRLTPWSKRLLRKPATLCFVAYQDDDGFPSVLPVVPCRAIDAARVAFVPTVFRKELMALRPGIPIALFGVNLEMESVLCRGAFRGYERYFGLRAGLIEVDWVYNSMPPLPGVVYPRAPLQAVTDF